MTPESIKRLQDFEGLRLKPYRDTKGKLTIGYGRNLTDRGISHDEAVMMFETDIEIATAEARQAFTWFDSLDFVRQDFIVMMIYNIGLPRLLGFHDMLNAIANKDWNKAEAELMDSKWWGDVGENRGGQMAEAIKSGVWV